MIEYNPRTFITNLARDRGLETWENLNHNKKYRNKIDWIFTFRNFNDDINTTETSFKSLNKKGHKLKLLLEELPTVNRMRLLQHDLYKDLKCPHCNNDDESFNHIFTCSTVSTKLQTIINNSKIS